MRGFDSLYEAPNYSSAEAALYLRLKPGEIRRWVGEGGICSPSGGVSFLNLLELHVLKGLHREFRLSLQRIRCAIEKYKDLGDSKYLDHPFLDPRLETDGIHMFLHDGDEYLNLNRSGQMGIPQILSTYLKRIDRLPNGGFNFFPFVVGDDAHEPRSIQISPTIAFGRPVLSETGIATEVIAGRFRARDSISDLAQEYGVPIAKIEDAVRWELPYLNAA